MAILVEKIPAGPVAANCYILSLAGREDCVMIDPGGEGDKLLAALKGRVPAAVLLTHGHFDHIGAVDQVAGPDTRVYIHPLDRPMLKDPALNASQRFGGRVAVSHPARAVEAGEKLLEGGMTFQAIHTPGHTPGGVCYLTDSLLFTGDTLFLRGYGRTDLGGSAAGLRDSLRRLMGLKGDYTVYPGHGERTALEQEREFYQ